MGFSRPSCTKANGPCFPTIPQGKAVCRRKIIYHTVYETLYLAFFYPGRYAEYLHGAGRFFFKMESYRRQFGFYALEGHPSGGVEFYPHRKSICCDSDPREDMPCFTFSYMILQCALTGSISNIPVFIWLSIYLPPASEYLPSAALRGAFPPGIV